MSDELHQLRRLEEREIAASKRMEQLGSDLDKAKIDPYDPKFAEDKRVKAYNTALDETIDLPAQIKKLEVKLPEAEEAAKKEAEQEDASVSVMRRGKSFSLQDVKDVINQILDERDERRSTVAMSKVGTDTLKSHRSLKQFVSYYKDADCGTIEIGDAVPAFQWGDRSEEDGTPDFRNWVEKNEFCSSKQCLKDVHSNKALLNSDRLGLRGGTDLVALNAPAQNFGLQEIEAVFELKIAKDGDGELKHHIPQAIAECITITFETSRTIPTILTDGCEFILIVIDGKRKDTKKRIGVNVVTLMTRGQSKFTDDVRPAVRMIHTILSTYHHHPWNPSSVDHVLEETETEEHVDIANVTDIWDMLDDGDRWHEIRRWAYSQMGLNIDNYITPPTFEDGEWMPQTPV